MFTKVGVIAQTHKSGACASDSDAQAFITATGISDLTICSAIDDLVIAAKANGWWTACVAIYPFVGGNSTTCKYNLKDPRDLDAAYRLSFVNSPTITANGVDWNGTSQYADTFLNGSTTLNQDSCHLSYYSRENTSGSFLEMGSENSVSTIFRIVIQFAGSNSFMECANGAEVASIGGVSDTRGFFLTSRTTSLRYDYYQNGVSFGFHDATPSTGFTNANIYIGASNNNGTPRYTDRQCAFATIGSEIDSSLQATMYTDIQAFQTALGRQV